MQLHSPFICCGYLVRGSSMTPFRAFLTTDSEPHASPGLSECERRNQQTHQPVSSPVEAASRLAPAHHGRDNLREEKLLYSTIFSNRARTWSCRGL